MKEGDENRISRWPKGLRLQKTMSYNYHDKNPISLIYADITFKKILFYIFTLFSWYFVYNTHVSEIVKKIFMDI